MKIQKEHYDYIKEQIDKIPEELKAKHFEALKSDTRVKDIQKRFRWDCFNAAGLNKFQCDTLYKYLDDNHIDTTLKSIVKRRD